MKGTEFYAAMANATQGTWDAKAYELAQAGSTVQWPWMPVPVAGGGLQATIYVASDCFAVGDMSDYLRLPVFPETAQKIADLWGAILPTTKIARAIFAAAPVKLVPTPMIPNRYSNLTQYVDHNGIIQDQLRALGQGPEAFVTGHAKDVVIAKTIPKGKVCIYGWFDASDSITFGGCNGERPCTSPEGFRYVQPFSTIHNADYVDYSQLFRLVRGDMLVGGQSRKTVDVLRDKALWKLLADDGPIDSPRYATSGPTGTAPPSGGGGSGTPVDYYALGIHTEIAIAEMRL